MAQLLRMRNKQQRRLEGKDEPSTQCGFVKGIYMMLFRRRLTDWDLMTYPLGL